jgi:hypothetical protein
MLNNVIVQQVREMLERHWTPVEIAHKMCVGIDTVLEAIKSISG